MPERPGTEQARVLFKSTNVNDWVSALSKYKKAVSAVAVAKKRPELVPLDDMWTTDFKKLVVSRNPRHILSKELSDIVKWKILRGRFRPLQKLVDSNRNPSVVASSTKALELLQVSDWKGALSSMMSLSGVGVATASAVLSAVEPALCPFMADEVIESVTKDGQREYSMDVYVEMQSNLVKKAKELGPDWNAELVGRALWTEATVYRYIDSVKGVTCNNKNSQGKITLHANNEHATEAKPSRKRHATVVPSHRETSIKKAKT